MPFLNTLKASRFRSKACRASSNSRGSPDDEPYISLAVAGQAQYLVTRDRDLLDLAEQATPEARELQRVHPGLKILAPLMFLWELAAVRE